MSVQDPIVEGVMAGWDVVDAATLTDHREVQADVVIIGTGAGGGTTAEILANAGLKVIMVEEGRLYSSSNFRMREDEAYPRLYQEGMARTTTDGAIAIMQGRSVGGSTTVNWTSSFRTPVETLDYWTKQLSIPHVTSDELAPWFADREVRLGIAPWASAPNENNAILKRGCERLGWDWKVIPRNVRGCWNLGYCGMGCPTNAKQSTLVTTVPGALKKGASLYHTIRAEKLVYRDGQISHLEGVALDHDALHPTGATVNFRARHFVVAASALGSPALLLRSDTPDPHGLIGKRSFLHPVNATIAEMAEQVDPFYGAPQSIYSDEFVWRKQGMGFKLEVPPLHPGLSASVLTMKGRDLQAEMGKLPYLNAVLALMRDGFHDDSEGGTVTLRNDGSPTLDYGLTNYLWHGLRDAYLKMAEVQFAAGAKRVRLVHLDAPTFTRWADAKERIPQVDMSAHKVRLFSAHQMGGCAMGSDEQNSVVNCFGEHHQVENLSVHDASVFPTSIGANPQLSIYALTARNATRLARRLGGAVTA